MKKRALRSPLSVAGSVAALLLVAAACGDDDDAPIVPGGDEPDASSSDAALVDATRGDGGSTEGGITDGTVEEAGPDAGSTTPCWPFDRPSIATLRSSTKKVFAHYFLTFPLSLDNKPAASDYYAVNYLNPHGESDKFLGNGGFLRERPVPQTPWPAGADYASENLAIEVRRAIQIGLDGFTVDLLSSPESTGADAIRNWSRVEKLLAVIPKVDPKFQIQLVFDMTASAFGGGAPDAGLSEIEAKAKSGILAVLGAVGGDPSLQRAPDGRVVVSAFGAEKRSALFWKDVLAAAKTAGHEVAFVPMPIGSWASASAGFDGVPLYGASTWGGRTEASAASLVTAPAAPHAKGLVWMSPVAPQDSRPKSLVYTEADNSAAFRAQWQASISGGADWVQLVTWNDYSEDSEIAPSSRTQTAFYDLSAYYVSWFKTGAPPTIARDALYYVHRAHAFDVAVAPPDLGQQTKLFAPLNAGKKAVDFIEVVGLLTAPGTLEISVGAATHTSDVGAGIQSFKVPLTAGTPTFRLVRGGKTIASFTSATTIDNAITYQDPLYHAGASLTCPLVP